MSRRRAATAGARADAPGFFQAEQLVGRAVRVLAWNVEGATPPGRGCIAVARWSHRDRIRLASAVRARRTMLRRGADMTTANRSLHLLLTRLGAL